MSSMADYAFLAGLAYRGVGNVTQNELDAWFGPNVAVNNDRIVEEWRSANNDNSAVSFKLIEFPAQNFAYVLIRGTTNNAELLIDASLWLPAFFMQSLRELLPVGYMFTPIMHLLINAMSVLESKTTESISLYKTTTKFVEYLLEEGDYVGVGVTGHSLGGGLSIITAAQTGIAGVALSGPNAMLSRQTFDPPITRDDIDANTFNIIPSRDLIPKFDIPGQNFQTIRCGAGFEDIMACHDRTRSLCEIIYSCGSNGRPVPCECVNDYGFPKPEPISNNDYLSQSFEEACAVYSSDVAQ